MIVPVRTLLCVFALVSASNAVVYRPDKGMVYQRRQTVSSAAAKAKSSSPPFNYGNPSQDYDGVVDYDAKGTPKLDTPVNQTSVSRMATVNSLDDFCMFGPLDLDTPISDQEERTVAWCTKPRNNARVIPDGTLTAVHFVKTDLYIQIMALGDFTKIGIKAGDSGGELDPHGATGKGNPIGGVVSSNITGKDVFYKEWMNYVGHDIMCFRVCTAGSDQAKPQTECEHTLDEMGCNWIMPGDYSPDAFDSCEADPAYPPGIFVENGSTSSFQQYATGLWTQNGERKTYTNGKKGQKTPSAAQSLPASSNCKPGKSPANGIASLSKSAEQRKKQAENAGGSKNAGGSSDKRNSSDSSNKNSSDSSSSSSSSSNSSSSNKHGGENASNINRPVMSVVALAVTAVAGFFVM